MDVLTRFKHSIDKHFGFLPESIVKGFSHYEEARLLQCVVRCGNGRFVCPLQDVSHFVEIIEREGSDYIRDVSLTSDELKKLFPERFII